MWVSTEAPGQGRVASASGGGADASRWPLSVGGAGAVDDGSVDTGLLRILFDALD